MDRANVEKLNSALRKASHKSRHLQMRHYQGNGDLRLLRMLAHHFKEATPSRLADRMEIALPTVSQKLSVLESRGLIGRKSDPNDRRKTIVFATEKGEELIKADYGRYIDSFSDIYGKLGREKACLLTDLLEELSGYIDEELHKEEKDETY